MMLTETHSILTTQGWKTSSKLSDGDVVIGVNKGGNTSGHTIKMPHDDGVRGQQRIIIKGYNE